MKEVVNLFEIFSHDKVETTIKNLKAKLMIAAVRAIRNEEWDIKEAAKQTGISEKRLKSLFKFDLNNFSIEGLLTIVVALKIDVEADIMYADEVNVMIL